MIARAPTNIYFKYYRFNRSVLEAAESSSLTIAAVALYPQVWPVLWLSICSQ